MNEKNQHSLLEKRLLSERPHFSPRLGFTERVMDNLPARVSRPHRHARIPWPRFILALGAAACIALVLTQLLPRDVRLQPPTVAESQNPPPPVPAIDISKISM